MMNESHYGIMVNPRVTDDGKTTMYAELYPAPRLIYWHGFGQYRKGWRNYWPLAIGRSWSEPHIRWWYEIIESEDPTKDEIEGASKHWANHDGGAVTLRQALTKASNSVEEALREWRRCGDDE